MVAEGLASSQLGPQLGLIEHTPGSLQRHTVPSMEDSKAPDLGHTAPHALGEPRRKLCELGLGTGTEWGERRIPYQSITVANGHSCPRHAGDIACVHTVLVQGLPEQLLKILLPFHHGSWHHQPLVGPQA